MVNDNGLESNAAFTVIILNGLRNMSLSKIVANMRLKDCVEINKMSEAIVEHAVSAPMTGIQLPSGDVDVPNLWQAFLVAIGVPANIVRLQEVTCQPRNAFDAFVMAVMFLTKKTQADLARAMDKDAAQLSRYRSGKTIPSKENGQAIVKCLYNSLRAATFLPPHQKTTVWKVLNAPLQAWIASLPSLADRSTPTPRNLLEKFIFSIPTQHRKSIGIPLAPVGANEWPISPEGLWDRNPEQEDARSLLYILSWHFPKRFQEFESKAELSRWIDGLKSRTAVSFSKAHPFGKAVLHLINGSFVETGGQTTITAFAASMSVGAPVIHQTLIYENPPPRERAVQSGLQLSRFATRHTWLGGANDFFEAVTINTKPRRNLIGRTRAERNGADFSLNALQSRIRLDWADAASGVMRRAVELDPGLREKIAGTVDVSPGERVVHVNLPVPIADHVMDDYRAALGIVARAFAEALCNLPEPAFPGHVHNMSYADMLKGEAACHAQWLQHLRIP